MFSAMLFELVEALDVLHVGRGELRRDPVELLLRHGVLLALEVQFFRQSEQRRDGAQVVPEALSPTSITSKSDWCIAVWLRLPC